VDHTATDPAASPEKFRFSPRGSENVDPPVTTYSLVHVTADAAGRNESVTSTDAIPHWAERVTKPPPPKALMVALPKAPAPSPKERKESPAVEIDADGDEPIESIVPKTSSRKALVEPSRDVTVREPARDINSSERK
jgi:hypothetical protein